MSSSSRKLLGWCKSNCGFALLNFAILYQNTFLNKYGYVIYQKKKTKTKTKEAESDTEEGKKDMLLP